ncbi:xylulose kinase-1 [Tanacetum coccineum]
MDDLCRKKGIKREYSVARTPQQNGVAERKNRTLIEAARTILADSNNTYHNFGQEALSNCLHMYRIGSLISMPITRLLNELLLEGIQGVSKSSTSSQQDQDNQDLAKCREDTLDLHTCLFGLVPLSRKNQKEFLKALSDQPWGRRSNAGRNFYNSKLQKSGFLVIYLKVIEQLWYKVVYRNKKEERNSPLELVLTLTVTNAELHIERKSTTRDLLTKGFDAGRFQYLVSRSEGFHQVIDFLSQSHISYALTKKPEIYISFIKQFWRTAEASTDTDEEVTITAIIDGQSKTITEASLRRHLKLEDHDGITSIFLTQ